MGADWAAQRIKGLSLWGAVRDGLKRSLGLNRKPNDGIATKTLLETFRYPRLGPGMMWEAARDKVLARGKGTIFMGHGLKQLAADGQSGWRMSATRPDGDLTIEADHAISSAPMRELARRLHPLPATTLQATALKYRDFLTVALKKFTPSLSRTALRPDWSEANRQTGCNRSQGLLKAPYGYGGSGGSGGKEVHRHAVDAVALAGRLGAVVEDMPEMPAAIGAMHLGARIA